LCRRELRARQLAAAERTNAAARIQRYYRQQRHRHAYRQLARADNPPLSAVQVFAPLLRRTEKDYDDELGNS
jgi:hypothetical protein